MNSETELLARITVDPSIFGGNPLVFFDDEGGAELVKIAAEQRTALTN